MEVTFQELRQKEVVSVETGARLGRICDLSFNFKSGCVLGFILPGKGFFSREDLFIPLSGVEKIGEDVILVRVTPFNCKEDAAQPLRQSSQPCKGETESPCRPLPHGKPDAENCFFRKGNRDRHFEEDL